MILRFLIIKINSNILDPMVKLFWPFFDGPLIYLVKGIMFLILFMIVVLIGIATRFIVIRKLFGLGEKILSKVPMVGKIYVSIKQMSNAFLGRSKGMFQKVVLLEYPRKGIYSIGFVTSKGGIQCAN